MLQAGAQSSAPATAEGLVYVLGSFPHTLWAIDPLAPAEQRVRWQYTPTADRSAQGRFCCDREAHGPIVDGGRVYFTTRDGHVIALDARTGALRFDVALADTSTGETLAAAPLLAHGRLYVGSAGDMFGARGWIAALDTETGKPLWKRYSTGPDVEVGIGSDFKPFYPDLAGTDLGTRTWPPSAWQQGGGSVAGSLLYDENSRSIIHETGRPAPWNAEQRPGDNRWTSGVFARDATSGAARWFTGFNAHNPYGYVSAGNDVPVELTWDGRPRSLLVHPDANGMIYVIDRSTGEILAADAATPGAVERVDTANGRTHYARSKALAVNEQTRGVCPAWTGPFGAGSSALPHAGLVALPLSRLCMDIEPRAANYIKGTPYAGANVRLLVDRAGGGVLGWDVIHRRASWQVAERWPVLGGTLSTESGLVFYGTLDGKFKALDGHTGKILWSFKATAGILSRPRAFQCADGTPCVAVVTGTTRLQGMSRIEGLDPRDRTAGFGWAGAIRQLALDEGTGSTLLVFRLQ